MAQEVAVGKRAKITQAQRYMIYAVLVAGVFLGSAIALVQHFVGKIAFNSEVIAEEEKAIASYSDAILNIGICKAPSGSVYTLAELKECNPDSIEASAVEGTLRYKILEEMSQNASLESVPRESASSCINPSTQKNYTYLEMNKMYDEATTSEELMNASELIQACSALRIIPDALPAFKNEEALLASLNKIFLLSGWEPYSLSPTGNSAVAEFGVNLNDLSVRLSVEANTETTMRVLDNIERSIREFNIERATIEWGSNDTLVLQAQATAYYMNPSELIETTKTIKAGDK